MATNKRLSVVQYVGENASTCGYCHSEQDTSLLSGLYCHSLRVDQYQQLVDRGWRRSGCSLYKPNMQHTCCPQYTIRLDVSKFSANKVAPLFASSVSLLQMERLHPCVALCYDRHKSEFCASGTAFWQEKAWAARKAQWRCVFDRPSMIAIQPSASFAAQSGNCSCHTRGLLLFAAPVTCTWQMPAFTLYLQSGIVLQRYLCVTHAHILHLSARTHQPVALTIVLQPPPSVPTHPLHGQTAVSLLQDLQAGPYPQQGSIDKRCPIYPTYATAFMLGRNNSMLCSNITRVQQSSCSFQLVSLVHAHEHLSCILLLLVVAMTHGILACCTIPNTSPSHSLSTLHHLSVCMFLFACTVSMSLSACTASHDVLRRIMSRM